MIIYPAIDLRDGRPVRLTKGDFATTEQVAEDALETARSFERMSATHLHMVDLDGALAGKPVNDAVVRRIVQNTKLIVQIGGGIRTADTVDYYLNDVGAARVILGSVAIKEPGFAKEMIAKYGAKIAIGLDAKDGKVSGGGWLEDSDVDFIELALAMSRAGARTIIYTDISRDGTLTGPDLKGLAALKKAVDENLSLAALKTAVEGNPARTAKETICSIENSGMDEEASSATQIKAPYERASTPVSLTETVEGNPAFSAQEETPHTDIIASGGVSTIDDIKNLAELGVAGVICGKSIYKGTLSLKAALLYQLYKP